MQGGDGAPVELFYSYSHEDEEYRKKLGKHVSVLRRAGLITDWHDRDIDAGTAWQEEIDRHVLSADIVLLLISAQLHRLGLLLGQGDVEGAGAPQGEKGAGDPDQPASVRLAEDAAAGAAGRAEGQGDQPVAERACGFRSCCERDRESRRRSSAQ
jgi:TIR domain-containing protein